MQDIFYKDKYQYTEPLNPIADYLKQLTFHIQTTRKVSPEVAKKAAMVLIRKKFKDRVVKCFERVENGDRVVKDTTLMTYIRDNLKQENIITPTFTTYMPRNRQPSILSEFILVSVAKRSKAKKEAHKAKAEGNLLLAENKNNEQNNLKTYNNSMSGAFAQIACILYNPSNHSTLTSITRTMTSMCNANNERFIAGNRYYPRPKDVLCDIIYIASNTDVEQVKKAVDAIGLHIPTVQEVVSVLKYSSDLYFRDQRYYDTKIIPYLENLSGYHLASICYSGDMYHLRKFNDSYIREMLAKLSVRHDAPDSGEDRAKELGAIDEGVLFCVHHMFFKELQGKGKDYGKMKGTGLPESIEKTSLAFMDTLQEYKLLFNAFFMTRIMPCNSFRLKNMVRRTVVLSDTDSTCFTLDEWVKWLNGGQFIVSPESISTVGVLCFMVTQVIINLLRILSRNLNVDKELIDRLGMKNEFLWLAHAPADMSKHYFAYTVLQEGTVLTVPEIERKGVHLKNSSIQKFVIDDATQIMRYILEAISSNQKVSFHKVAKRVLDLEADIKASVFRGEPTFLKRSKIKTADAYAEEATKSPYARHTFWNDVFGHKYGTFPEPPYDVIKVPTILRTKTAVKNWLTNMEDSMQSARLMDWFTQTGKDKLPTIYLNETFVAGSGIPVEILQAIDIDRIILDVTKQHRIILETLGVILYKDKLVSDQIKLPQGV